MGSKWGGDWATNSSTSSVYQKWLKIRGKRYYWFVVLDVETELPILASLLGTKSEWACKWVGVKLKSIGKLVIITDGLLAQYDRRSIYCVSFIINRE